MPQVNKTQLMYQVDFNIVISTLQFILTDGTHKTL